MEKIINMKLVEINEGHCRILYKCDINGQKGFFFSLQDDFKDQPVKFYRNSNVGPWFEPEYPTNFKPHIKPIFERPIGDSILIKKVNQFIDILELK